jgi:hypothetical protein
MQIDRRNFLAAAAPALLTRTGAAAPGRPNIILLEPDSWDGRALGYLGHPAMRGANSAPGPSGRARHGIPQRLYQPPGVLPLPRQYVVRPVLAARGKLE